MGSSMILPVGDAIRPRMPASWRIWLVEPRAPESAIMLMGLNFSILSSTCLVTSLVACSQMRMTLV